MGQSEPLEIRKTIRRHQLREMVPLADSTIYEMEQRGDEMERQLDEVSEHLEEAKQVAANPPMEPDEGVAGDWEGEATGSSQGEDAEDATGDSGEGRSET